MMTTTITCLNERRYRPDRLALALLDSGALTSPTLASAAGAIAMAIRALDNGRERSNGQYAINAIAERIVEIGGVAPEWESRVNHPAHYGGEGNRYEAILVIEGLGIGDGFCLGNAMKYVLRAGKKGGPEQEAEDLAKAIWYLRRRLEQLESEAQP